MILSCPILFILTTLFSRNRALNLNYEAKPNQTSEYYADGFNDSDTLNTLQTYEGLKKKISLSQNTILDPYSSTEKGTENDEINIELSRKFGNSRLEPRESYKRGRNLGGDAVPMLKRMLSNASVTCNDKSRAGYYTRKNTNNDNWIIFLEVLLTGGWYCSSKETCGQRFQKTPHLMSSKRWPGQLKMDGMLSNAHSTNPYWADYNIAYLPYCSSDLWSGTHASSSNNGDFSFMGSRIIEEVIKELIPEGLIKAKRLLLVGTSAGGIGVALNVDKVQALVSNYKGQKIQVLGVSDSAWFLENAQYSKSMPQQAAPSKDETDFNDNDVPALASKEIHKLMGNYGNPSIHGIKIGLKYWNGLLPDSCKDKFAAEERWKCYFINIALSTIKSPLFVFQWLFDEAQMRVDKVGVPLTKHQWDYINRMGKRLRNSFANVSALFSPSCISHGVLTKKNWHKIKINKWTLPDALKCWEEHYYNSNDKLTFLKPNSNVVKIRKKRRKNRLKHLIRRFYKRQWKNGDKEVSENNNGSRRLFKKRHRKHTQPVGRGECPFRLIDNCNWPQCNQACPKLTNPLTGHQLDFVALLKSFGLNMRSVAHALMMEYETLENMDNDAILNLLTQNMQ